MSTFLDLINKAYGSLLLGTLVATFISGMNTLQTIVYFRVYPEDTMRQKALVVTVWGLDIIHTGFLWSSLWFYFITSFGDLITITVIQKPDIVPGVIIVGTIVDSIVHMFYVHRIFHLSYRNYWIATPAFILVLCDVASTIGTIVILYRFKTFSEFINSGHAWVFSLGFIFAAASDIVIMAILFDLLRSSRRRSMSLNNAIDQLVLYTLETGSLTALIAIAIMTAWLTAQDTYIFLALWMSLSKVYATALLGSLNTRYHMRHSRGLQWGHDQNMTRVANPVYHSERMNPPTIPMQTSEASTQRIHVDVTKSVWVDDENSTEV